MTTEADIPESIISIAKREGEIIYSASGQFDSTVYDTSPGELKKFQEVLNVTPETVEYLGETKYTQGANDVGAEAMNTVNVETPEGEKFLGSPSAVPVSVEDTCRVSTSSEPKEVTLQVGNERLKSNKQVEVAGETGTEENKVTEDSEEKPEKNNMSHDIINSTNSLEEIGETSSKEVEKKEAEKSNNLIVEVPEATKPSERAADVDEKEKSIHEGTEETFTSTTDVSSIQEAGYETGEKPQEASSISYDEKSQDKIELSKKMECTTPDEDEINHKKNMDKSAMQTEETNLQKVDSTEPLKVVSKIWPDVIIKESPDEVKEQIEMSEKTVGNDSASNETGKENECPEQKGDGSFVRHEGTLSENEVLPAKEASSGENRYEEESFITVTKDNIADTEIIDAIEHKQSGTSNSEDRPENLQQNEPEKEKLEGSLNVVAEDFNKSAETITSVKEETPIKTEEKSSDEEIKRDLPDQTNANVSLFESHEKTQRAEVEVPNKNANDLHGTHSLVEEAEQNEGKNLDKVFNSETEGKIQEAYEECTKEKKDIEDAPEVCPGERAEKTDLIPKASETDIEKLQDASGPDFEEKSVIIDNSEKTDQEMQKNGEACDTETQEILANSADAGKCVIDAEASAEVNNAAAREEKVAQNIQLSPLEAASELTSQDESCIADYIDKSNNITNEEEHDETKIAASVVAINEQVIEDNVTQISPESIDKQNVEICEGNKYVAEELEGENNREPVIEDRNINCLVPESVDQVPSNREPDLKYEKKEAEESTEEIFDDSDTAPAAESIVHETIKNIEGPKEILDGSTEQQGESLQSQERNLTPTETSPEEKGNEGTSPAIVVEDIGSDSEPVDAKDNIENKTEESEEDLEHVSQRNEPEEDLPPSLSTTSEKKEAFNSDADKTPVDVEEGPTQNLEEALHKEENEKETETAVTNDFENSKTTLEEDLEKIAETSDASKSKESIVFEPRSEMDKMMVEDEIKKEESEQLFQDSNDGGKDEETEKHNIKEECGTTNILPESIGGESFQSSKEEKIEQSPQGDESTQGNDTYISSVSTEQETLENSESIKKNKEEYTEGENNSEQSVEERNSRRVIPESVEQSPVKNLEDGELKEDESTGEISKNSETSGVAESAAHETSTTIESTAENFDSSLVKQGENLQNEEKNIAATEPSAEENRDEDRCLVMVVEENRNDNELLGAKDNIEMKPSIGEEDLQHTQHENEPDEKHERSISVMSSENEAFSSSADKTPCLTVEGTSLDLDDAPQKEENDKETEEKNDTEDTKIETKENLEIDAESSDASKNTDSIVLELKSDKDTTLAQDEMKKEESEELHEDSKNADKSESEKEKALGECGTTNILPEPIEEETHQSFEEGKVEEIVKTKVCKELETTRTSVGEDAEKQIIEENTIEQSRELEVEKVEKSSKEDDMVAKTSKQEQCEITQIDNEDDTGRQKIEKGGADENKFELFARGTNTEDSLVKENEEKEHDKQAFEAEASSTRIEKQDTVQAELLKDQVKEKVVEENSKENESTTFKLKDQVDDSNSFIEEIEATISAEETVSETLKDRAESNMNSYSLDVTKESQAERPTEESVNVSHMSNKETEEEMEQKEENTINDLDSACITVVREEKGTQEAEPEDKKQEESVGLAFEDKGIAEIETKQTTLESVDIRVKPEDTPDLGEKRDNEIPTVADKTGETNEGLIEESAMVQHTPNKETEEEMTEKEENIIGDSDSSPITMVTEAKGSQETEPEDKELVESVAPAFEEKGIAETETKETNLESVDHTVKAEVTSDLGKKRDKENPTVADTGRETNGGLTEESAMVSHMSNEETEEKIKEKEETSIDDTDSASVKMVTEEKGLQDAEAEDINQVESVGPAFEEKGIAEIETALETVDNDVKSEDTSGLGEKTETEIPTVADAAREINEGLIKESAMVPHTSNKETEEEIKEKEETSIQDLNSASITMATEAKGLQQAEPEDKKQLDSFAPAFEEKNTAEIETKETALEGVDIMVKSEDTSDLGKKKDNEIPTVADKAGETNEGLVEESATVSCTPNKETVEEIKEKGDTTTEDSYSVSITDVTEAKGLQEAEPEEKKQVESVGPTFEEKGVEEIETKETNLESVDVNMNADDTSDLGEKRDDGNPTVADKARERNGGLTEESAMVSTSNKETEEEIEEKKETSINDSDSAPFTVVIEEKDSQEAEPEDKKQVESVVPAFEEKGISEIETKETTLGSVDINVIPEDTTDLDKKRDSENPTVADNEISTVTDTVKDTNEGIIEESAMVSHTSDKETEEEIRQKEETTIGDSDSASITAATEAKGSQEAKGEDKKQAESVGVGPAFEEKGIAEIEAVLETVDNNVKPEDTSDLGEKRESEILTVADAAGETMEGLIEESAMVLHTSNKETEEEIKEKEEISMEDSNSASIALITEAKGSQEAEAEDKKQVESVDPAFEEKGITETETKERALKSIDINVEAEDTSDLGEKRDREIPKVADEAIKTIDSEIQNEGPEAGSEDDIEVTTTDKPLEEISKDDPREYSTVTKEHELTTTEVTETVYETSAKDQALFENTETTCVAKAMDETSTNKQDKIINPLNVSESESLDIGKETVNEEVQKQKVEPENAENFSKSEDVEISKGEETGKPADQGDVCKSTTLKYEESSNLGLQVDKAEDEKPVEETLKTFETSGVCTKSEKAILEQQISKGNGKEVVEVENAAVEQEGEAHSKRHENVNNTDDGIVTEEKLECTSEAVTENETSETLPESVNSQIEENSSDNQNREDDKDKKESQLEAEEHEEQNENETTKAVILTEKEQEEVEKSDDSGDIKELVVEEDRGINELHASSTVDETTDKMENSDPVSSEYNQAVDSKEQTKAENSETEEDSGRETEASLARETEKQKAQDKSIEPGVKELKEKIGETAEESQDGYNEIDDATLTEKTETSTEEAELGDKLVKDSHIEATEAVNSQQDKEVDNMKPEETSELASDLPLNDNGHAERESATVVNRDVGEPEETKIASETVFDFRDLGTKEVEVGESQTVEKPDQVPTNDADNAEGENAAMENSGADETEIVSNAVDETKELGTEETAEIAKGSTLQNMDQIPTSDFEHTLKESAAVENSKVDEINEIKVASNATYESNDQETEEFAGETPTVENREVGEEPEETKIASEAVFESNGLGAEETEVRKNQKVETSNDDNVGRDNAAMENSSADEVEETKTVADEVNEIKVFSDTIYESKGREAEEVEVGKSQTVEKPDQIPTNDDGHAERENAAAENSGADEVEETKLVSDAVGETKGQGAGESAEAGKSPTVEKMDQLPTSNCEHAQKESVAVENPRADGVNEIKVSSDATYESNDQDTEESAEEIPTVEKLDQVPAANFEQAGEERVTVQYPDAEEDKETKKNQITEDVDETGKTPTEDNPDADKTEKACKAASDHRAQGIEPVTENEIIADQTPSADKLNEQLQIPAPTLPFKDEATATGEEIEEEKPQVEKLEDEVPEDSSAANPTKETSLQTESRDLVVSTLGFNINKDIQDSPTEVYEEEGQTPDETSKLELQENENKMKCDDSSSESKANTDQTGPSEKACNLESETSVKALQSEAAIHDHEKPTESEDTEIKDKYLDVISDVRTEENQCKKTREANEIIENEVSKEEIAEEKEVAKTCQSISLSEERLKKSLQEDELKAEECREAETNNACKTRVSGIQNEEPPLETVKATASTNIIKHVAAEDRSVDDSVQVLVENKIIKESFPQDFEGKDVKDSAIKLDPEYQGDESNFGSGKAEVTTSRDEDSSMDISQKENMKQLAKYGELIQETEGSKESSCATIEKQIPTEAELIEHCPDTTVQTGNEHAPPVWQEGIIETPQKAEAGDLKSGNAKGVHSEAEVDHGEEQTTDCSGEQTTEGPVLADSTKGSLSDLLQRSRKETTQVAKLVSKETEPTARTEENQTVKPETIQVKEAKLDEEKEEEEGEEHNKTDSSASDAPVMVEASKDMDAKAVHKKSHNILSGVGSKVKHSISKVKKAITGKSSHTKPV